MSDDITQADIDAVKEALVFADRHWDDGCDMTRLCAIVDRLWAESQRAESKRIGRACFVGVAVAEMRAAVARATQVLVDAGEVCAGEGIGPDVDAVVEELCISFGVERPEPRPRSEW